jgi:thiol-disulfide isomerase/thioredoxin
MDPKRLISRRGLLVGGAALATSSAFAGLRRDEPTAGRGPFPIAVGSRAPELIGGAPDWLNTDNKALRLYGKGGLLGAPDVAAVLVDFWEYTCVNCIRTLPYLKEWHRRYADKGLVIVGVHTPEFEFGEQKGQVAASAKRFGLNYPLVNDARYANWNAYGNQYWPRKYLLDRTGRVVYEHAGEGAYGDTEAQIQRLLKAARPGVALPRLMDPVRGADKPGAVCYPQTREIYAGFWRGPDYFRARPAMRPRAVQDYTDPAGGRRENGVFYAHGRWRMEEKHIRHARATDEPFTDYIALRYAALEANAVLRAENGKPFDLFLQQDGRPLGREDKGEDVRFTDDGRSFVRVDAPRMYQLVANRSWGQHELKLGAASDGMGLYSFTFSSCEVAGAT